MRGRILQLIPSFSYGDAVSNDAIAMKNIIQSMSIETEIYAGNRLGRATELALSTDDMPPVKRDDIAILHLSTGDALNYRFAVMKCRKVVVYHNVTPPAFFRGYHPFMETISHSALRAVKLLAEHTDYAIADSEFNKADLIEVGYSCPIDVLPIIIPFDDYNRRPKQEVLGRYADDRTNILFAGRIVPNKKVEDVIASFYCYKRDCDPGARLFIVGSYMEGDVYYNRLRQYIDRLGAEDVIFTGHISFEEILAYFHLADVYLSLSEHEGFCVPLVEAMYMDIPVIAYDRCAVAETLGGSGILLPDKKPEIVAGTIERLVKDGGLRKSVLDGQKERLAHFSQKRIADLFRKNLTQFMEKVDV